MEVALLYNPNDKGINGKNWKLNNYRFFREELPKHVDLKEYPILGGFDCGGLKEDVVIFWRLLSKDLAPMELFGWGNFNAFRVTRTPDAWEIDETYNQICKSFGIDLAVSFQSPHAQKANLEVPYERYIFGIDPDTYKCPDNWDGRRKDKILSSGVLAPPGSPLWFYYLRTELTKTPYVEHVHKRRPYLGVDYWKLLTQYRAAIACMSLTSVLKYFEIPMCGCLMFAEVNHLNQIQELGFEDMKNCVYINRYNYEDRMTAFLDDPDNPRWKKIADAGHKLVKDVYSNEKQVARFVKRLEEGVAAASDR